VKYLLALAILLCPFSGQAQWMTVATNAQTVTVPAGMLIRYGSVADNLWINKQYLQSTTFSVGGGQFPVSPDPSAKSTTFVLQAYQVPLAQAITVAGQSMSVPAATVTAAKPPPATPTATSVAGNKTFTVNMTVTPETNQITPGSTCGFQ
jgi:hypothetical protein